MRLLVRASELWVCAALFHGAGRAAGRAGKRFFACFGWGRLLLTGLLLALVRGGSGQASGFPGF
ncbi:MAG: hypothetical protein HQL91_01660 [Magnetococcales bacterium]|nr:hypothetical protein [Magnetococcales bacterium]